MASTKLATLAIRTAAKPISNQLKVYAQSNERFRGFCASLAQQLWRTEIRLRENLLGEKHHSPRPLSENKAIQNGANALAEGFLFSVAASLILAETYRSSRSNTKRRENLDDRIEDLEERLTKAHAIIRRLEEKVQSVEEQEDIESAKNQEISRILSRIVDIGLRGGWAEFEDTPVPIPQGAHLQGSHHHHTSRASPDAPATSEARLGPAHSASASASSSPNWAAPVTQTSEQPVPPPMDDSNSGDVRQAVAQETRGVGPLEPRGSEAGQPQPPSSSS